MENNIPKDENYTGEGQVNAPKNEEKPHKVEIEINKFQNLVKALNDPRMLAKIIMVTCIIVFLLFLGISLIAMMLKKFYPYNVISTNEYGATFIQNEDKDVIYWLFNSADLWANSGVEVKKGDIVTIHTSGAFHTAIHHLADDAKKNILTYNWMKPGGGKPSSIPHDDTRAKYRIAPYYNPNTILMQVIPKDYFDGIYGEWWRNKEKIVNEQDEKLETIFDDKIDGGPTSHIYAIGEGQDNIEIQEDGYLCFAVNDIALTRFKISEMMRNVEIKETIKIVDKIEDTIKMGDTIKIEDSIKIDTIIKYLITKDTIKDYKDVGNLKMDYFYFSKDEKDLRALMGYINGIYNYYKNGRKGAIYNILNDSNNFNHKDSSAFANIKGHFELYYKYDTIERYKENPNLYTNVDIENVKNRIDSIENHFNISRDIVSGNHLDTVEKYVAKTMTELDYYYIHNYINAWYDDNVGSFLVVIERKNN